MRSRRTARRWAMIIAGVAACAAGLVTLSPAPAGVLWDDAVYVILAKALATGEGYRYIHLPGQPTATLYPPLWPSLLSVVWRIAPDFPDNLRLMKLLNPLLLGVVGAGATLLMTRVARVPPVGAAVAAVVCMATTPMLMVSSGLMSEPLGMALMAFALIAATSMVERGQTRDGVIAGTLVALAVLARSASVVLLVGLAVGLLWKRSRRASAVALVIALGPTIAWFTWNAAHARDLPAAIAGSYGPYLSWFFDAYRSDPGFIIEVARKNVVTVVRELGIVVFGIFPPVLRTLSVATLLGTPVVGLPFAGRRAMPLTATFVAYTALLLVWPYSPGRFVWAFLPFAAVAVVAAARGLRVPFRHAAPSRATSLTVSAVAAIAFITLAISDVRGLRRGWHATAIEQNADALLTPLSFISQNTSEGDVVASDVHLTAYLYLGRSAVPASTLTVSEYLRPKPTGMMEAEMAAIDSTFTPDWWVIGSPALAQAFQALAARTPSLQVVARLTNGGLAARRQP